jgi:hypothetical protein
MERPIMTQGTGFVVNNKFYKTQAEGEAALSRAYNEYKMVSLAKEIERRGIRLIPYPESLHIAKLILDNLSWLESFIKDLDEGL